MPRNLDMTALRSFVTVAEAGGVTRAAGILNLTQSAVSMQLKRLEEALGLSLLDRSSRAIALTSAGEQLKSYAQRMLVLNDEIWGKLTAQEYEGELSVGVPHDIIYPNIPKILKQFAAEFPRMQVRLVSAPTRTLRAMFARGECDFILTTEDRPDTGGESLIELDLIWIGAVGGSAWHQRPLPVAFCSNCIFRPDVIRALDDAGIAWDMIVDSELDNAVEAAVSADLGVHAAVPGNLPPQTEPIEHGGVLPALGTTQVNLYHQRPDDPVHAALAEIIRSAYRGG